MSAFLRRTLRGARLIELGALTVMVALALVVYTVKARAGRETGDISQVEGQIADEQKHLHLLEAEAARLERPDNLQRLAESLGLQPTADTRETTIEHLADVARPPAPTAASAPAKPAAPPPTSRRGATQ